MFLNKTHINPFFKKLEKKTRGDKNIWICVVLLFIMSILVVYSTSGFLKDINPKQFSHYLLKQIIFILLGLLMVFLAHRINYMFYYRMGVIGYFLAVFLLIYTLFFGVNINESVRWVRIPGIDLTFQPSDFAKTALIIFLARKLSRHQKDMSDFKKTFLPMLIYIGVIGVLILPANLSTAVILTLSCLLLLYIGRARLKHLFFTLLLGLILPIGFLAGMARAYYDPQTRHSQPLPAYLKNYRLEVWIQRMQNFLYNREAGEMSYQNKQAYIAIARGKLIGVGPGNSEQKYFLPLAYSDFIYAIIIEEYGLITGVLILSLYLYFLYRCIIIFRRCPHTFGAFLSIGLSFMLVIQALVNILVNIGLLPTTGIGLPLISMGGSSYVLTCISIGIILSVSRNIEQQEGERAALS